MYRGGHEQCNFLFNQISEQTTPHFSQIIIQKQVSRAKAQQTGMQYPSESMQEISRSIIISEIDQQETKLIIVQPTKSTNQGENAEERAERQFEGLGANGRRIINNQDEDIRGGNIVFHIEDGEDFQEQPQSSIRKLYKAMKHSELHQRQHEVDNQQPIIQNYSQLYKKHQKQQQVEAEVDFRSKKILKSNYLFDLVSFSIPKTKMIRCLIKVSNDSFFSLERLFQLYLIEEKRLLMSARKRRFRIASKFQIFGMEKDKEEQLAVIRSNYTRTQYKLLLLRKQQELSNSVQSSGFISDIIKISDVPSSNPAIITEQQKCYLSYESNFFGFTQQKVDIIRPKKSIPKADRFSDIKSSYENYEYERVAKFSNRSAEKDKDGKLVLDFKEQKVIYSTRNMIIENEYGEAGLMFAKRSDNIYLINVMHPFSLLEGFFLGICNLDKKILVN